MTATSTYSSSAACRTGGRLSKPKRKNHFEALTDAEIEGSERAFAETGKSNKRWKH